jgi:hypothetical protein
MGYIQSKSSQEYMLTFININKFELLAAKHGEFYFGRPYQIIFLKHKNTNEYFIVVNIHNGKDDQPKILPNGKMSIACNKENIQQMISRDIDSAVIINSSNSISNLERQSQNNISHIIANKNFNTIVLGDFNDLWRNQNFWKDLQIFKYSKYNNLNNIIVSTNNRPPYTCCSTSIQQMTHPYYGDYISIDNTKLTYLVPNQIHPGYNFKPSSDHLPVYAEIQIKSLKQQNNQIQQNSQIPQNNQIQIPQNNQIQQNNQIHQTRQIKKYFTNVKKRTLRLLDKLDDPNDISTFIDNNGNKINFKGKKLKKNSVLIFPNGNIYNNYIFVTVENNTNIIGYINYNYLYKINNYEYKLDPKYKKKLLRLKPIIDDPKNHFNNRGLHITSNDTLIIPNGQITQNNLVIIQDANDPSIIGYIRKKYLL